MEKVSDHESEQYFHSRPRGSQIGAVVSNQVGLAIHKVRNLWMLDIVGTPSSSDIFTICSRVRLFLGDRPCTNNTRNWRRSFPACKLIFSTNLIFGFIFSIDSNVQKRNPAWLWDCIIQTNTNIYFNSYINSPLNFIRFASFGWNSLIIMVKEIEWWE